METFPFAAALVALADVIAGDAVAAADDGPKFLVGDVDEFTGVHALEANLGLASNAPSRPRGGEAARDQR